ncbi:MAG: DNA primase [Gammaproteobacteria bacterium]|nr:DNA primase [Gammaproteobacteria bacterium]
MAGLIPQNFIDDLLNRVDIVDVIDAYTTLKKAGKNYKGLCPFHQEKTPSFSVEPDKQFYYCFGCGAGGNALGFLMNYENMDYVEAIEKLASQMGMEVPREESNDALRSREKNQVLFEVLEQSCRYYQTQLRKHPDKTRAVEYLKSRGLSGEIARDFALGYAPPGWSNLLESIGTNEPLKKALINAGMLIENPDNKQHPLYDRFRDRIIYPIRDNRGRIIAFGGRVLGDDKPKYLNSPETPVFHKGEELYGLYEARKNTRKLEKILIVEGYMDVIALAQNDITYSVATLGTATSTSHLRRLFKLVPEVVFCFDGDDAGREAAWRALEQALPLMEDGRTARFLFLPDGADPDTEVRKIGKSAFVKNMNEATQLAEYFFQSLGKQVDMNSLEGRARLGRMALPHIEKVPKGIYHQLMLDQLSTITGVALQTLAGMEKTPDSGRKLDTIPVRSKPPVRKSPAGRSVCMRAVNLILLKPGVAADLEHSDLAAIESPDMDLLLQVVTLAKKHPASTTPELLGRIYATPLGSQLTQLLNREQITPTEGIEQEFNDIIGHLLKAHHHKLSHHSWIEQARQKLDSRRNTGNSEAPGEENTPDQG